MATIPPHPLTKPHADPLAGLTQPVNHTEEEQVERRVQELMLEWQRQYFLGAVFTTPAQYGPDITRQFEACEIRWGKITTDPESLLPLLHSIIADRRDGEPQRKDASTALMRGEWTFNTFVRAGAQQPVGKTALPSANPATISAENLCRKVADQYAWLLRSRHAQELSLKGVGNIRILSGPKDVQSGPWHLRQIVYVATVHWQVVI
jgi:hypothetical protein